MCDSKERRRDRGKIHEKGFKKITCEPTGADTDEKTRREGNQMGRIGKMKKKKDREEKKGL